MAAAGAERLVGRDAECAALDRLVAAVAASQGAALVVRGGPGLGKTSLLEHAAGTAPGFRVLRAVGVQSEMELAYAGLHQLVVPELHRVDALPVPQQQALRAAIGLASGPAPDRFLVALAALGLLSEAAAKQPVLCLVDDEQWLDRASVHALAFVARRLQVEPIGLVIGSRSPGEELAGLPELAMAGLAEPDARLLLDSVLVGPVDQRVRDLVVAEARGNPLALLELPRGLTAGELAGGFGLLDSVSVPDRIEQSFLRQLSDLPGQTRRLVAVAAADVSGDPALVWSAAHALGIPADAAGPVAEARLLELGARVRFRHPLVRSAAYHAASVRLRQDAHAALAAATNAETDPDRRAWHLAQAAPGPDEAIALELEHSAARAQRRGGLAAQAAFLERAALLTPDPEHRAERLVAAARAKHDAGAVDAAEELLAAVEASALEPRQQAEVFRLRGRVCASRSAFDKAVDLFRRAVALMDPIDAVTAREIHLEALFAGKSSTEGGEAAARIALRAPPGPQPPRPVDLLLDGLALLLAEGHAPAAPVLRGALDAILALPEGTEAERHQKWFEHGSFGSQIAIEMWDFEAWRLITTKQVALARELGALAQLQDALNMLAGTCLLSGDLAGTARLMDEERLIAGASGNPPYDYSAAILAAWQGREAEAMTLTRRVAQKALDAGSVELWVAVEYGEVVLHNSMGRYQEARDLGWQLFEHDLPGFGPEVVPELAEAAARAGDAAAVQATVDWMAERTSATRTEWALGLDARIRALASDGDHPDALYQESVDRLRRTPIRAQVARTHLLYGEWLRRRGRRLDAREQLRTAYAMFEEMGMAGFAERTRRELAATGETARRRTPSAVVEGVEALTPQEAQIARLARDGLSNPEIGARLFISSRTVQYHLKKVFAKLDISSRGQLYRVLEDDAASSG